MSKALYSELENVLKHFSLEELNKNAINQIQDINWNDIVKQYEKTKLPLSRNSIITAIIAEIKELELSNDVLIETIENLKMLAMVISKTKTWQTYKLLDQSSRAPLSVGELNAKLKRKFLQLGQKTEIHSIDHDGKFVISIKTVSRKKSIEARATPPIFIIFQPSTNYIFSSKILKSDLFNSCLTKSLGYQRLKIIKLNGKNPNELLKILLQRDDNCERIAYKEPEYVPKIKTTRSTIDCTRTVEKLEYADQVFNENLVLQSLTFNIHDRPCVSDELRGEKISATMTLTAPNVKDMIKDLIEIGAIDVPVPDYLKDVLKRGRNSFEIGQVD